MKDEQDEEERKKREEEEKKRKEEEGLHLRYTKSNFHFKEGLNFNSRMIQFTII